MTDPGLAPRVIVKAGRGSEVFSDERRAAVEDLCEQLRSLGIVVDLQVTEYIPGNRGIAWVEQVGIFIGAAAGSGLVGAVVNDVYSTAKNWARKRFSGKNTPRPEFVILEDENGNVLSFKVSEEGEEEEESKRKDDAP